MGNRAATHAPPVTKAEQFHDEKTHLAAGKTPSGETQMGHLNVIHFLFFKLGLKL